VKKKVDNKPRLKNILKCATCQIQI